jgi:gliding motility-associated lipoprotein GldD
MKRKLVILACALVLSMAGWYWFVREETGVPKPRGYFRIALPEPEYRLYDSECPLAMEVSTSAKVELFRDRMSVDSCWFNIYYPKYNARIHCTYMPVNNRLPELIEDAYGFAAKHEMKASALRRTLVSDSLRKVYGIVYDIEGDAASNAQFFLTDSTNHFLRGALYFFNPPNPDSIAPVLSFVRGDINRIAQTLQWD